MLFKIDVVNGKAEEFECIYPQDDEQEFYLITSKIHDQLIELAKKGLIRLS